MLLQLLPHPVHYLLKEVVNRKTKRDIIWKVFAKSNLLIGSPLTSASLIIKMLALAGQSSSTSWTLSQGCQDQVISPHVCLVYASSHGRDHPTMYENEPLTYKPGFERGSYVAEINWLNSSTIQRYFLATCVHIQ